MLKITLKINNHFFEVDDVITIKLSDGTILTGKIAPFDNYMIDSQYFKLDVSSQYNSKIKLITISDIDKITKL